MLFRAVRGDSARLSHETTQKVLGTSLRVLVDGVVKSQVFDSSIAGPGAAGLRGTAGTYDNFKIEQAPLGNWEFTTDNGTTWTPIGAVSDTNARLLAADANTRLRFVANPGAAYYPVVPTVVFRAWNGAGSTNGSLANASVTGSGTPLSSWLPHSSATNRPAT